jgi:protein-disulfide isomerase
MSRSRIAGAGLLAVALAWGCGRANGAREAAAAGNQPATAAASSPAEAPPSGTAAVAIGASTGKPRGDSLLQHADLARTMGAQNAPVWLVMASDFQCPFCKQWHDESFVAIRDAYVRTGAVRLAYLNYPLPIHRNAWSAAETAMCAAAQGGSHFWDMHDALFADQGTWAPLANPLPHFDSLAVRLGLDATAFRACIATHATRPLIEADHDRSAAAGVGSTPTFFIGRTVIEGAQPLDTFRRAIDSAVAAARAGSRGP